MIQQSVSTIGLSDIQRRVARLSERLRPDGLRRPSVEVSKALVRANKIRLARGVDVHGRAMRSGLAKRLGLVPLGGEFRTFGRSVKAEVFGHGDGVDLYSTFIGADVAYKGKTVRPKTRKYLTIPLEAKGGEFSRSERGNFLTAGLGIRDNRTGRRAGHYENTFFMNKDGKLFLVAADNRKRFSGEGRKKLRFLFLLVRSAQYPKNEWLGVSNEDLSMAAEVYGKHLDTFEDAL